jgi:hypothetical protein
MGELTIYGEIMNAFLILLPPHQLLKLEGDLKLWVPLHPRKPFLSSEEIITLSFITL